MSFITTVVNGLKKLWSWLDSPKAVAALESAAKLAVEAGPIVAEIAQLAPNSTFAEVAAAYAKYGVPFAVQETTDPTQLGNYLLNLASVELKKVLPASESSVTVSLLNTAVQLALIALKSGAVPVV